MLVAITEVRNEGKAIGFVEKKQWGKTAKYAAHVGPDIAWFIGLYDTLGDARRAVVNVHVNNYAKKSTPFS